MFLKINSDLNSTPGSTSSLIEMHPLRSLPSISNPMLPHSATHELSSSFINSVEAVSLSSSTTSVNSLFYASSNPSASVLSHGTCAYTPPSGSSSSSSASSSSASSVSASSSVAAATQHHAAAAAAAAAASFAYHSPHAAVPYAPTTAHHAHHSHPHAHHSHYPFATNASYPLPATHHPISHTPSDFLLRPAQW